MTRNAIITGLVAVLMAGFVLAYTSLTATPPGTAMGQMPPRQQPPTGMGGTMQGVPAVPPVKGYTEGQEIRFLHTEASDPQVAQMLTTMMSSPVLVVPSLALAPASILAAVYVFTNGVRGDGPFGFQPDVFDRPP
jgi:hypothetical protein